MRSASDDLTTRARIRNAAIALIGEHGFAATTMRMIAQAAEVSPALVVHHFGDKAGLRAECDAHVTLVFTAEGDSAPTVETLRAALADLDAYGPALAYLSRMVADESGEALFDGILQGTLRGLRAQEEAGIIRPQQDAEITALLLTAFGLAPVVLRRPFARALGEEDLTPGALARLTVPLLELFTHGLYADDAILQAAQTAMADQDAGAADKEEGEGRP